MQDGAKIAFHARVGEAVTTRRKAEGMTPAALATACSVSRTTIGKVEDGIYCPLYVLAKIAEALDCTLDELVPVEALS